MSYIQMSDLNIPFKIAQNLFIYISQESSQIINKRYQLFIHKSFKFYPKQVAICSKAMACYLFIFKYYKVISVIKPAWAETLAMKPSTKNIKFESNRLEIHLLLNINQSAVLGQQQINKQTNKRYILNSKKIIRSFTNIYKQINNQIYTNK
ncbi:hypothetical protein TTHERM_000122519 (macronuclear) [Tetrahymena thermophila SB210]|uniref:Uncharacterized protein n=1 Tax=Tetrahymena thermophila (strain SB210) TaxID=312017 RepID=W7XG00_TETTS|nr:hypothetical protein TTHERM_000122519 [Tetrahymena thermophila SB210]EWS75803.1 hypothetical protein TTHERM_000122519 [Tetrahymena thermophila SB210]|eukprot:XP_012651725.1 hypothetical protein TTHERM_000122519 [Tetrahymena thermophila SB210]